MGTAIFGTLRNIVCWSCEELSLGQTLYLPIYSQIWHGDRIIDDKYPLKRLLSALVSIRNTSFKTPIRVISAKYYSTEGKLLKEYISKPVLVNAMATYELFVERKESEGGSGANFIIQWDSPTGLILQSSKPYMPILIAGTFR
ncbi:MAG: DUF3124 domain-containing protein [Nitrosomonadales bacterium]